ncbi:hypothetical protein BFJ68_g516 [Fusarium oxysporum]|uniref:Uncharacterized protein n=1 Tax=Fusarium oxysporum TaxID=5507 RepID=A0A420S5H6_FUSOX|nr:hypothetical protein BFJ68_g516 [Fusarium oxysporum]
MGSLRFLLFASIATLVSCRDVPDNIKVFKQSIIKQGSCNDTLAEGFHSADGDDGCKPSKIRVATATNQ